MDTEQPQWTAGPDDRTEPGLAAPEPTHHYDEGPSRLQRIGILIFAICSFFFFLVMKLPEARIQNLVIAYLRIAAQEQGFLFSAEKVRLGLLLGPSVKLYNVELKAVDNERQTLKIPYLKVSPKLLSLLSATKKASIKAELLEGDISGTVGAGTTGSLFVDLDLDDLDLGATNLVKRFLTVDLAAKLNGSIRLDLDSTQIQKSEGAIKLKIEKLTLPAQALMGTLSLPKLSVSESNINISIANGAFTIKEFDIGKDGKNDDIVGKVTGEGTLNRFLDRSTINAKAVFTLSPAIKQSIPLLDALLGSAKTPDGKYAYRLNGPLSALEPVPGQ
jgi:type II secretion system protein N